MMKNTTNGRAILTSALLAPLWAGACQYPNPGFLDTEIGDSGGTSEGDVGGGEATETKGSDSTGDGDGDATTGIPTTGDGDGTTTGDGDGDGSQECGSVWVPIYDDTFFQQGGDYTDPGTAIVTCDTGSTPNQNYCVETNFGITPAHWVGEEGDLRAYYAFHPGTSTLFAIPEGAMITGATFEFLVQFETMTWPDAAFTLTPFHVGLDAEWSAGYLDGGTPQPGSTSSTFKYRVWDAVTWTNWDPANQTEQSPIGSVPVGNMSGVQWITMDLDPTALAQWITGATSQGGETNGFLLRGSVTPYNGTVSSLDDALGEPPLFTINYCVP